MTAADKSIVYRIVGFLEYGTALRYFEELLKYATADELEAIQALIVDRPEFSIYTNLARRLQSAPSSLVPDDDSTQSNPPRRGLEWMMALARAEIGGVLATFGSHPSPFEAVAPTQFEMSAYREILLDGAQTHYWALANDSEIRRIAQIVPNTLTLAYLRRLGVARHFLVAAIRGAAGDLSLSQVGEATRQIRQIENLHQLYAENVTAYLAFMNSISYQTSVLRHHSTFIQACYPQLDYEPQALASGKARVEVKDGVAP